MEDRSTPRTIVLTGGGTAGHVTPNLALIPRLQQNGFAVHYIGTENGIERSLVATYTGVTYHAVASGKLRRYFSWRNFTDPFRVVKGLFQAAKIVKREKPEVIFSKGGFVSVPVVIGAWFAGAPVILHESDYSPGLANRISAPFAKKILVTFDDTLKSVGKKGIHTGTPIRSTLFQGDRQTGFSLCGFAEDKPVLLVMGGSQGAAALNKAILSALPRLLGHFSVVHLCGEGKVDESVSSLDSYKAFSYLGPELPHILAISDVVVSRAGANAVFEFLALKKPCLLVPLPAHSSRGDQIQNARYFHERGYAHVLQQESITDSALFEAILGVFEKRDALRLAMDRAPHPDGTQAVLQEIYSVLERKP